MQNIYLDNAATTALDPAVIAEMVSYMEQYYGNPSSIHAHGRQVKAKLEAARRQVAKLLGAEPGEVFFTSCGTEADNIALRSMVRSCQITRLISSRIEHHAVSHTVEEVAEAHGLPLEWVRLDERGQVDYDHLESLLAQGGKPLVSLMHGNNEIGNLLDLDRVGKLCQTYGAMFHCDMVQTIGHYDIDFKSLNIHAAAASAHKFHGPKGAGMLYLRKDCRICSLMTGGGQERNMRPGTENVLGILGFAKSLALALENRKAHADHIRSLKVRMMEGLKAAIPDVRFNGTSADLTHSLYTVLSVSFPPFLGSDMMLFQLDLHGISASGGSACSSGVNVGSHVMQALGAEADRPNVRFSFSRFNTADEIDLAVAQIRKIVVGEQEEVQPTE